MATFHPFPRLPYELRVQIWKLTVEPRTVSVGFPTDRATRLCSSTPVPAILQTCREARNLGLYKKDFSELLSRKDDPEERYIWLNLDIDLVSIGKTYLKSFAPVQTKLQRLELEREWDDEFWEGSGFGNYESQDLEDFVNLREVYIVMQGFEGMYGIRSIVSDWPCGADNVTFIDQNSGERMKIDEIEQLNKQLWDKTEAEQGYNGPSRYPY